MPEKSAPHTEVSENGASKPLERTKQSTDAEDAVRVMAAAARKSGAGPHTHDLRDK